MSFASYSLRGSTFCTIAAGQQIRARLILTICALQIFLHPVVSSADVPTGDAASALHYYAALTRILGFSTIAQIQQTRLDDVANYLGYSGLTGADLQNLPPAQLMNPGLPLGHAGLVPSGAAVFSPGDIIAIRFFAPKIMNIKEPEATRQLGWRKLVRLRAQPGSAAATHHIASGIILFNIFTQPGAQPFSPTDESVNTQVMLVTENSSVPAPNVDGPAALYWLDYEPLSKGGTLSLALNAFFDANELPQSSDGHRPYFVPDGCVACHGNNGRRPLINYLDTDHWFDRLDNDFPALKASGLPLVFDAQTNDSNAPAFKTAFDVIRKFNAESDDQVARAQPKHDEALASHKWVEVHAANDAHVAPIDRAIGPPPQWSRQQPSDENVLNAMNQYCFRCHGTVKFSVFNRQELRLPQFRALIDQAIQADAPVGLRMPPDRDLPAAVQSALHEFTR